MNYGSFGLKPSTRKSNFKQIEAARVALTRHMKNKEKYGQECFQIFCFKKPTEVRMGKGKGSPEFWACRVKPGRILFEVDGVSEQIAKALYKASAKLPIKCKFIKNINEKKRN